MGTHNLCFEQNLEKYHNFSCENCHICSHKTAVHCIGVLSVIFFKHAYTAILLEYMYTHQVIFRNGFRIRFLAYHLLYYEILSCKHYLITV